MVEYMCSATPHTMAIHFATESKQRLGHSERYVAGKLRQQAAGETIATGDPGKHARVPSAARAGPPHAGACTQLEQLLGCLGVA